MSSNMNGFPCDWSPDRPDLDLVNGHAWQHSNGHSTNQGQVNWVRSRPPKNNERNWVMEKVSHNKVKVKVSNTTYVVTLRKNREEEVETPKTSRSPIRDIFKRFSLRYRKKKPDKESVRIRPCKYILYIYLYQCLIES